MVWAASFGKPLLTIAFTVLLGKVVNAPVSRDPEVRRNFVRKFNKCILNPFAIWVAARRPMYYGVLHHIGRRSGKVYATPVVAKLTPDGVVIPLPYGSNTDWCRNVLAAGTCTLTLNGQEYKLSSPEVVPAGVAAPLVPPANAVVWRRFGIGSYLTMKRAIPAAALERVAA